MAHKIVSAEAAIAIIQDGDVIATTGYGGNGVPEQPYISTSLMPEFSRTSPRKPAQRLRSALVTPLQ